MIAFAMRPFVAKAQHEEDAHTDGEHRQAQCGGRYFAVSSRIKAYDQNSDTDGETNVRVSEESS